MGSFAKAYDEAYRIKVYFETQGLVARSIRASLVMTGALIEQAGLKQEMEQQAAILQEAIALCKQVALLSRRHYLQEEVYKSQYLLGRLFALQGDTTKAAWHFGAAIAQIERILNDLLFDLSPSFLRTAWRVCQEPLAKAQGLVPHPKMETIGRLTTTHQQRMYRHWQEKRHASPEYCRKR